MGYVLIQCGCIDRVHLQWPLYLWHVIYILSGKKSWRSKGSGHTCKQAWAWQDGCWWMCIWGMGKKACAGEGHVQVSADSDAWRMYK